MSAEKKAEEAKAAIDRVMGDTSVSASETLSHLRDIIEHAEVCCETIEYDLGSDDD